MKKTKLIIPLVLTALLSACAPTSSSLYTWGTYEETLFVNYHEPAVKEEMLDDYLAFVRKYQGSTKRLAPGLFAEAGTFMLERNNPQAAIEFYELERQNWPESEPLMTTLITNLQERSL